MEPFNFMNNFPTAGIWPPVFNPQLNWPVPFPYGMQPMQQPSLQQLQQPSTPQAAANPFPLLNYTPPSLPGSMSGLPLTPAPLQQLQPPPCFITPPSDNDGSSPPSPPPSLQPIMQPTPTGRPAAAAAAAADLTPPTLVNEAANETQPPPVLAPVDKRQGQKRKLSEDNEQVTKRPYDPTDPSTNVFCRVGGRLSVVGGQRTYNVTVAEIERRTRAPECLPLSLLGPLLKRGKVKGCGGDLKKLLETRKIPSSSSDSGRRKPAVSTLSALLEEEASQLATDHRELLHAHFPLIFVARLVVLQQLHTPAQLAAAAADTAAAQPIIDSFSSLLDEWTSSSPSSHLSDFSLVTHGLGLEEARSLASLFSRFLATLAEECSAQSGRVAQYPMTYPQLPAADAASLQADAEMMSMGQQKFAEVDGRLTLHSRKYAVTVAEITRRLRAPESLNLSTLGSILRRGKTSNTGADLRDELAKRGIRVDQGRRKAARLTCFTAMVEEEALILARDLADATTRFLPVQVIAAGLNSRAGACTAPAIVQRRGALAAASQLAALFSSTLTSLRLPVSDRIPQAVSPYAHLIRDYSSLTHGYGPDVCVMWLEAFRKVFDASRDMLPLTC